MLNAYYFRKNNMTLAPVYAKTLEQAYADLPLQHGWCAANRFNVTLHRIEQGTEWDRICQA